MKMLALILVLAANASVLAAAPAPPSCSSLSSLAFPGATITTAEQVPAGAFTPPSGTRAITNLPAFCRVAATLKPTADSDIGIEVWLPLSGWNGKFEAVGNGGWGGAIEYSEMAAALQRGYATSSSDDGHEGDSGDFVLNHPERFIDFAYRSEHEMTLKAKALISAFYGQAPRYSYWNGCSGGGREGLLQAYRYPDDFNGVIAGDPATFKRNAWAMWIANASFKNADDYIPPSKYSMIHRAVLDMCDKLDGLQDGLINDPRICHFDPKVLLCKGADGPTCLTARQVQTARTILSPMKSSTGAELFPRLEPGTELRWARLAGGPAPAALFLDYFRFVVKNPNWDWRTFDVDRDTALANKDAEGIVALDPDLSAFAKHGGKLIMYHGWADQQVAPEASIELFDAMQMATVHLRVTTNSWVRLFMMPGMAHCSGGEGPDNFDKMGAIENWVEQGREPDSLIASELASGKPIRTRPLCPYPLEAKYNGSGDPAAAANFSCAAPSLANRALSHEGAN
ncbi:MAG TPA: tannase/feruloyl esterase family alpha/beta hydrolase [Candidatus Acidoferrum sp.]|nr:tannase/feruloyl esterase family alpha/beta hydrolase [Candidatus Acidoferrum sp.]